MLMRTESTQLLLLLNWMSPTFPIGSFAYSHGLEQAIADGRLKDAESVEAWIADLLLHGSGWNDAVLFAKCWDGDVGELNEFALALAGSRERYLEMTQLGRAFTIAAAVWTRSEPQREEIAYTVAAGRTCRNAGVPQEQALVAFVQGFCAALVSVAVRLVPLGQTQGLEVLRNLAPVIQRVAVDAAVASLDDIGGCSLAADIATMQHEMLEPRIFRT
jgi:urease accessory protein